MMANFELSLKAVRPISDNIFQLIRHLVWLINNISWAVQERLEHTELRNLRLSELSVYLAKIASNSCLITTA